LVTGLALPFPLPLPLAAVTGGLEFGVIKTMLGLSVSLLGLLLYLSPKPKKSKEKA
jgi:predicted phage tail protein